MTYNVFGGTLSLTQLQFTYAKYISMKFCWFVASSYPHMPTNFAWFIIIFNKMALIFLGVGLLIVFAVSSFEFQQVRLPWLHRLWMSSPKSPDLSSLDHQVWRQWWSLNKTCNKSQNQFTSFKMHFSYFGLPYRRKTLTTLLKTTTTDFRHVCQPMVDILNI